MKKLIIENRTGMPDSEVLQLVAKFINEVGEAKSGVTRRAGKGAVIHASSNALAQTFVVISAEQVEKVPA